MATSQAPLPDAIDDSSLLTKYPGQFKALGPYELSGFKKGAPIKAIELLAGTKIYRFDMDRAEESLSGYTKGYISGWWSLFDNRYVNQMSARDIYETACLNGISFSLMTRYFSAVRIEWNALINYVEVTLQKPVAAWYGEFEPMALSGEGPGQAHQGNMLLKTTHAKAVQDAKAKGTAVKSWVERPDGAAKILNQDPNIAADMISAWCSTTNSSSHWNINSTTGQPFPQNVISQSEIDRLALLEGMSLGLFEAYQLFIPNFKNEHAGMARTVLKADISNGAQLASHFGSKITIESVRAEREAMVERIQQEKKEKLAASIENARQDNLKKLAENLEKDRQANAAKMLRLKKSRQ
jgi:hypothetical protein